MEKSDKSNDCFKISFHPRIGPLFYNSLLSEGILVLHVLDA